MPERFMPGLLDIFGHSHQWWHVLIVFGLMFWHHGGVVLATYRLNEGCDAHVDEKLIKELALWPF